MREPDNDHHQNRTVSIIQLSSQNSASRNNNAALIKNGITRVFSHQTENICLQHHTANNYTIPHLCLYKCININIMYFQLMCVNIYTPSEIYTNAHSKKSYHDHTNARMNINTNSLSKSIPIYLYIYPTNAQIPFSCRYLSKLSSNMQNSTKYSKRLYILNLHIANM